MKPNSLPTFHLFGVEMNETPLSMVLVDDFVSQQSYKIKLQQHLSLSIYHISAQINQLNKPVGGSQSIACKQRYFKSI